MASWPRALRLAQRFDVVYLNSTVWGRLLPALRGVRSVLHVHDIVDRVPVQGRMAGHQLLERQLGFVEHGLDRDIRLPDLGRDPPPRSIAVAAGHRFLAIHMLARIGNTYSPIMMQAIWCNNVYGVYIRVVFYCVEVVVVITVFFRDIIPALPGSDL